MNRKKYQQPMLLIVNVNVEKQLLAGSLTGVDGNASLKYGGSGSSSDVARGRNSGGWLDDDIE